MRLDSLGCWDEHLTCPWTHLGGSWGGAHLPAARACARSALTGVNTSEVSGDRSLHRHSQLGRSPGAPGSERKPGFFLPTRLAAATRTGDDKQITSSSAADKMTSLESAPQARTSLRPSESPATAKEPHLPENDGISQSPPLNFTSCHINHKSEWILDLNDAAKVENFRRIRRRKPSCVRLCVGHWRFKQHTKSWTTERNISKTNHQNYTFSSLKEHKNMKRQATEWGKKNI